MKRRTWYPDRKLSRTVHHPDGFISVTSTHFDPDPYVIELARRMAFLVSEVESAINKPARFNEEFRDRLFALVQSLKADLQRINQTWVEHEDVESLRKMLGLAPRRGRPRTRRHATRMRDIATAHVFHEDAGATDPTALVMEEFGCSEKTIQRALTDWGNEAETELLLLKSQLAESNPEDPDTK